MLKEFNLELTFCFDEGPPLGSGKISRFWPFRDGQFVDTELKAFWKAKLSYRDPDTFENVSFIGQGESATQAIADAQSKLAMHYVQKKHADFRPCESCGKPLNEHCNFPKSEPERTTVISYPDGSKTEIEDPICEKGGTRHLGWYRRPQHPEKGMWLCDDPGCHRIDCKYKCQEKGHENESLREIREQVEDGMKKLIVGVCPRGWTKDQVELLSFRGLLEQTQYYASDILDLVLEEEENDNIR